MRSTLRPTLITTVLWRGLISCCMQGHLAWQCRRCTHHINMLMCSSSGRTLIRLEDTGQEIKDLAAGETLGEGLDGVPPVQKDHSISGLQAFTQH